MGLTIHRNGRRPTTRSSLTDIAFAFQNADHAFSVSRRIIPAYTGNLIRAVRSSDSAERDIPQTSSQFLDTADLLSWSGADSVTGLTVYNQVGSGDMTMATAASRFRLANAGVIDLMGDRPVFAAQGATQGYRATLSSTYTGTTLTAYVAATMTVNGSTTARAIDCLDSGSASADSANTAIAALILISSQSGGLDQIRSIRSGTTQTQLQIPLAYRNAFIVVFDGTNRTLYAAKYAGTGAISFNASSDPFNVNRLGWAVSSNSAFASFNGQLIGESAVWFSALNTQQCMNILANASNFWGI